MAKSKRVRAPLPIELALAIVLTWAPVAEGQPQMLLTWGSLGSAPGQFWGAAAVATDRDGMVYVADTYNYRMQKFNASGELQALWGSFGSGPGQFNGPGFISAAPDGSILIRDWSNYRVQRFAASGTFLSQWPTNGLPFALAVDPSGSVYVTTGTFVDVHLVNGLFLRRWSVGVGAYSQAAGVGVAPDGYVYAADYGNGRIQKFNPDGVYQGHWPTECAPTGIALAPDGSIFVSCFAQIRKYAEFTTPAPSTTWGRVKAVYR